MSDHWNLLADQLGTPNLAPRSKKTPKTEAPIEPAPAIAPVKPKTSSRPTDVPEEILTTPESLPGPGNSSGSNSDSKSEDKPRATRSRPTASSPRKPKPATEAVQDKFGDGLSDLPGSSEPNLDPETVSSFEQFAKAGFTQSAGRRADLSAIDLDQTLPTQAQSVSNQEAPLSDSKTQPAASRSVESRTPVQQVKEPQVKEPRERSMLQSSWDALANLFGVSSDSRREPTETPVAPKSPEPRVDEPKNSQDRNVQANRPSSKRSAPSSMWDSEEKASRPDPSPETIKNEDSVSTAPVSAPRNRRPEPRDLESVESDRRGPRRAPRRGQRDEAIPAADPDRRDHDRPRSERRENDKPLDDRRDSDRRNDDRPRGERRGNVPREEDRRETDRRDNDRPVSERRDRERTDNDRPVSDRRDGDRRDSNRPTSERRDGNRPTSERRDGERRDGNRPTSDRRDGDRRDSDRRGNDRPAGDRRDGDRRDGDRRDRILRSDSDRRKEHLGFAEGLVSDTDPIDLDREDQGLFNDQPEESNEPSRNDRNRDSQESSSSRERRPKRRGRRNSDSQLDAEGPSKERSADSFDEFEDPNDSDRSDDSSESRPKHGKVPSWTETIGAVIESNVANHQKNSSGSRARHRRPNH